ncbi:MAG: UbiA family prenyltransferase [Alphaproteobacteria bacterium]|nr:UbiA family prenyltransferase [Alphaproteobacteria bacterium]
MLALLRLVRIHAAATAAALALLGARLAASPTEPVTLVLVAVTVALATAGGNALNDVHDREIDAVNRADRPIPSGAIGVIPATVTAVASLLLAILGAALLSPWCLAICLVNCGLLAAYARFSKRLGAAKSVIVGGLVGSAVLYGAVRPERVTLAMTALAACAVLATVAREIVKDVEDIAGDRAAGARTLPIVIGARRSRRIADAALVLAVAVAFVPLLAGIVNDRYLPGVLLGGAVLGIAMATRDPGRAQRLVMAGSVIEMAAFYLGTT